MDLLISFPSCGGKAQLRFAGGRERRKRPNEAVVHLREGARRQGFLNRRVRWKKRVHPTGTTRQGPRCPIRAKRASQYRRNIRRQRGIEKQRGKEIRCGRLAADRKCRGCPFSVTPRKTSTGIGTSTKGWVVKNRKKVVKKSEAFACTNARAQAAQGRESSAEKNPKRTRVGRDALD